MKAFYILLAGLMLALPFSGRVYALDPVGEYNIIHKEYGGGFTITKAKNGTYNIDCGVIVPEGDRGRVHGFEGVNGKMKGNAITFDVPYQKAKVRVDLANPKRVVVKAVSGSLVFDDEITGSAYSKQ